MNTRRWARDLAVAVAAAVIDTALLTRFTEDPERVYLTPAHLPAGLILGAGALLVPVLLLRRRAPVAVAVGLGLYAAALTVLLGSRPLVSLLVSVFTVAAHRSRAVSLACLVPVLFAQALAVAYEVSGLSGGQRVLDTVLVSVFFLLADAAAWGLGVWAGWTVRQRARAAEHAAGLERVRIARDMHDTVAHSVTLMLLHSGGAARLLRKDPERAGAALAQVDQLGQQAIAELRMMLELLEPEADLRSLLAHARSDRLAVEVEGEARELEPAVNRSAYRILQEALTNATRYAAPEAPVRVQLVWSADDLELNIENACPEAAAGSPLATGHGLAGMHDRARAVGGTVEAGRRPDGNFVVRAVLPIGTSGA